MAGLVPAIHAFARNSMICLSEVANRMFFFEKKHQKTFAPLFPGGCISENPDFQNFLRRFFLKNRPLS